MPEHDFAACIGLDWGDQQHAVCLAAGGLRVTSTLAQRAEDIEGDRHVATRYKDIFI